jgi:hypothetical protein
MIGLVVQKQPEAADTGFNLIQAKMVKVPQMSG